jgi:predicted RNA-binding Zn-ribbon protein involved in translation (DUF1610 family)
LVSQPRCRFAPPKVHAMQRLLTCPKCGHSFTQTLPDVSVAEGVRLKAAHDGRGVSLHCPNCQEEIWLPLWSLPDLPMAP